MCKSGEAEVDEGRMQRKGLKAIIDKTAALDVRESAEGAHFHVLSGSLPGVATSLHDLFTRIEAPETWQH